MPSEHKFVTGYWDLFSQLRNRIAKIGIMENAAQITTSATGHRKVHQRPKAE